MRVNASILIMIVCWVILANILFSEVSCAGYIR
jgi:hypothetical protein